MKPDPTFGIEITGEAASAGDVSDERRIPLCDIGRGNCIPPGGANDGDVNKASDGEDSAWRKDGVGGTASVLIAAGVLLKVGVWMVRLAGRRLAPLEGIGMGDDGASKWCFDVVSSTDAVAIGGRD